MAETEEQPNLDKDECLSTEPECGPESDSMDNERAQMSVSETTTSKASEPQPELLLLGKQLASSDQNEATRGEANATTTDSEDSGEQFEVVQLTSFSKEEPCKELEEGGTTMTPPQDDGDKGEKLQDETKEPDREKEAYEEMPAPQAVREDQEVIAPTQTEEGGADSGRTTPKEEEESTVLEAEKKVEREDSSIQQQTQSEEEKPTIQEASETEVVPIEAVSGGEGSHTDREEEEKTDEKMETEASEVAGDQDAEGFGGEQQQEGSDGVEEDLPEMETESRIDTPIQSQMIEHKEETESGDAVVSTSDDAAPPMEDDIQKEGDELSETKMEIESAADENVESMESEDARKNETTFKDSIPPEADVEIGKETATEHVSPSEGDMETGNVTVAQSDAVPVEEEAASVEASKKEETTTQSEEDSSNLKSSSPAPQFEDKQVDPEPAKEDEGDADMAEEKLPLTSCDKKEGGSEEEEEKDDDEQGLPLVQLGGATGEASVEREPDEGSVQKQEDSAVEKTLSADDADKTETEPTKEPVETVEADDNFEKIESDIRQPDKPMEPDTVEQRDEDEAFKLELSFESSEPDTVPSKETSIHIPAEVERSEVEKEPDEGMDKETAPSTPKGDQEQVVDSGDKSEVGTQESEEPTNKMEVADSSVVPDAQEESIALQEHQTTESAGVVDQSSVEQKASHVAEVLQDTSGKTLESADEGHEVTSSSPLQSEASDPKETTSLDDSSNQPLLSAETYATAPPSSTTTSAPVAGTASVGVSSSTDIKIDSTLASTVSTNTVKEAAVSCTIKTRVTVSTPPLLHVDPTTTSKAPLTSSSTSETPPTSMLASTSSSTPSVAPPTTTSSSSEPPSQAPPTATPTSTETPSSITPPATTSPSSFKVPSLSNVPSLSLLAARSSALPHVLSTARATPTQAAVSKSPSSVVQSTSDIGAKLPSFDTPDSVSLVPTITIPAISESKSSSGISASAVAKAASSVSTAATSSVSTLIPVAHLSSKAVSTATPAMTSLSTTTTPTSLPSLSSTTLLMSPSPSITTTTHHKSSPQQLLPSPASKPHANTISVITQLPASFTASKTATSLSSVASSTAGLHIAAVASSGGSGHHGIVLGVGSVQQREQNIIVGMQGAERLKVGEAEILQVSVSDTHDCVMYV